MWLGSKNGLVRYDGYDYKYYLNDPRDSTSICGNFIRWICEDINENLWIATDRSGFCRYNLASDEFETYQNIPGNRDGLPDNMIWCILEDIDQKGEVFWIATRQNGLVKFNYPDNTFTTFKHDPDNPNSLPSNNLITLCQDEKSIIWIGTFDSGLVKFDKKNQSFKTFKREITSPKSISSNYVWTIIKDSDKKADILWIGTNGGGLNKFDIAKEEFTSFRHDAENPDGISSDIIMAIHQDRSENEKILWIGTWDGGLSKFIPEIESGKFISYSSAKDNPYDNTSIHNLFITEDLAGTLWIGTQNEGISLIEKVKWKFDTQGSFPDYPEILAKSPVTSICEDHSGNLWFATNSSGLFKYNTSTKKFRHYKYEEDNPNSIGNTFVLSVLPGKNESLWIGTGMGLDRLYYNTGEFVHYKSHEDDSCLLSSIYISSLCEIAPGVIWAGTNGSGINVIKEGSDCIPKIQRRDNDPPSLSSNRISFLYKDSKNRVWVGTYGGITLFSEDFKNIEIFDYDVNDIQSLSNNATLSFLEDRSGTIWIGTAEGLNRFDEKNKCFKVFNAENGLENDVVLGILEDDLHNLWLSTNKGLVKFNPNDGRFRIYTTDDGLQNNEFDADACFRSSSGQLFFGGPFGFDSFFPENVKDNPFIPSVYITSFKKFNAEFELPQSIISTNQIELSHKDDFFSFEFTALNFINPEKNKYRYKLEGFKDDWINLGKSRTASFTGLQPGDYRLVVQASNNDNKWNFKGSTLEIIIHPPYWQTWWFRAMIIVLLLLVIYFVYENRLRNIQRQKVKLEKLVDERTLELRESEKQLRAANASKDKFFSIISHDLKSPLSGVMGLTNFLGANYDKYDDEEKRKILVTVNKTVKKVYSLIENLLSWSRMQTGRMETKKVKFHINEVAYEVRELLSVKAKERNISISLKIDQKTTVFADREMISTVIRNLMSNAVKFTPDGGSVDVNSKLTDNTCVVCVKDTGTGIEQQNIPKLFREDEVFKRRGQGGEEGTGLGLMLCKEFVEKNGGKIWVESEPGKGSLFCFTVPVGST